MEAAKGAAEAPAKTSQEVITGKARKTKASREEEKVEKEIESRLEFLARMYAANKTKRAEEESEEEEEEEEESD